MSTIRKENIKRNTSKWDKMPINEVAQNLSEGDISTLARCITWIESENDDWRAKGLEVLCAVEKNKNSALRIGITGVPGVGKSTFIEAFGMHLINDKGLKIAVLAVDPTSQKSQGSILGDKTRMETLAKNENAFIRPSSSRDSLGGVTHHTKESIRLCEVAGFDVVVIETVGVGQSETAVHELVDFFLLLMLAGAGDELQGIKRGIMEMADALVINKADGENKKNAIKAKAEYKAALHLFPPTDSEWIPEVKECSALENTGIVEVFEMIERFQRLTRSNGYWNQNRLNQDVKWMKNAYIHHLIKEINKDNRSGKLLNSLEVQVLQNKLGVYNAFKELVG